MANKLENIVQMASNTAAEITKCVKNWTGFLATAANLYRYSFPDQLLIHAQRPNNVKACAEFDVWTKRMKYYVRRGARGIALVDMQNGRPSLRYVFDIADTGRKNDSHNLYLWQYKEEYQDVITKELERYFGVSCSDNFIMYMGQLATSLAKSYWKDYKHDIMCGIEGSSLENLDERSCCVKFCNMAAYSIAYMLLIRCGFNPGNYHDAFNGISDFNTQNITKILGHVVSEASGDVLHQIAIAIFAYEREKKSAQSTDNPDQTDTKSNNKSENHNQPSSFVITVDNKQTIQPSIKDIYEQYKPIVKDFLLKDMAYLNACKNSDKENAFMEGLEAVRRAALSIKDLEFMKLFYDLAEFHNRMQQEVLQETYPELSKVQQPDQDTEEPHQKENPVADTESAEELNQEETVTSEPEPASAEPHQEENTTTDPKPDTKQPVPNPDTASPPDQTIIMDESEAELLQPAHEVANYRITDDHLGEVGAKDKYTFNMYAIVMLKQIESENRIATPGEQEVMGHYMGWGGIPQVFEEGRDGWEREYRELPSLLTPEEYASARASVLNSHFTSPVIIRAIYVALSSMGFECGNILEPSMGIGNFFGCLPESMMKSRLYGVEIDSITGRIAKQLYPKARISICGYEKTNFTMKKCYIPCFFMTGGASYGMGIS